MKPIGQKQNCIDWSVRAVNRGRGHGRNNWPSCGWLWPQSRHLCGDPQGAASLGQRLFSWLSVRIRVSQAQRQEGVRPWPLSGSLRVASPGSWGRAEKRFAELVGESGADLFNAPDRAAFVKWPFFPNEG